MKQLIIDCRKGLVVLNIDQKRGIKHIRDLPTKAEMIYSLVGLLSLRSRCVLFDFTSSAIIGFESDAPYLAVLEQPAQDRDFLCADVLTQGSEFAMVSHLERYTQDILKSLGLAFDQE